RSSATAVAPGSLSKDHRAAPECCAHSALARVDEVTSRRDVAARDYRGEIRCALRSPGFAHVGARSRSGARTVSQIPRLAKLHTSPLRCLERGLRASGDGFAFVLR